MNFFKELFLGYKNYVKGTRFLFKHHLYWYFSFPIFLFICVYLVGTYFMSLENELTETIQQKSSEIDSINELIWTVLKVMFFDGLYIILTQFTLYIVVVLLSPVLAMLSEKIEEITSGKKFKYDYKMLIHDIRRGVIIAVRNLIWYYIFVGIFLGLASIAGISTKSSFVMFAIPFIVGFYYYGFSFMDYVNERRRLNIQQSIYYVSQHKGLAISIGSVYSIFFLMYFYIYNNYEFLASNLQERIFWGGLIIILLIIAALTPILAITAATLSMNELSKLEKK
ncbi:MAG: EI24 domain-containing protein [Putridiphycobacter sp.]